MANVTYFEGNRYTGDTTGLGQYFGVQSDSNFQVLDSAGILIYIAVGVNFTYGSTGFFNSGTITYEGDFSSSGQFVSQTTNANIDVATRNSLLSVGTSGYSYYQYILRGDDNILGSAGEDSLAGSKGNDHINGGGGLDVLTFKGFSEGVTVDLSAGFASTSFGSSTIVNVEDIEGSSYDDVLSGNSKNNQIQGFGGADRIDGGAGFDTVVFFDAVSGVNVNLATGFVFGGSGDDTLVTCMK
jgi:Ca2+-binding RTX toxin-like protein